MAINTGGYTTCGELGNKRERYEKSKFKSSDVVTPTQTRMSEDDRAIPASDLELKAMAKNDDALIERAKVVCEKSSGEYLVDRYISRIRALGEVPDPIVIKELMED